VPDHLESLIGEKRFLKAALLLVRSIKTVNKPEIAEVGAVTNLREYFVSQETVSLSDPLQWSGVR
jgi:exocyst complex component 4